MAKDLGSFKMTSKRKRDNDEEHAVLSEYEQQRAEL